jgi:hypothetical protein
MVAFNHNGETSGNEDAENALPSHEKAVKEFKKLDELKENARASLLELLAKIQKKGSTGKWVKSKNKGVEILIQIQAVEVSDEDPNLIGCTLVGDKILDFAARGIPKDEDAAQPE